MVAIEIDPNSQTVRRLQFDIEENWAANIVQLMGTTDYCLFHQLESMDILYTDFAGIRKRQNRAFLFCETGEVVFGKAILFGLSKLDLSSLVNCRLSIKAALELIVFCDEEESEIYREFEIGEVDSSGFSGQN